jgi:hypothetical protein
MQNTELSAELVEIYFFDFLILFFVFFLISYH